MYEYENTNENSGINIENYPLLLARQSVEHFVKAGREITASNPPDFFESQKSAFVTIKSNGRLRGCIGTIAPAKDTLAEEIISNAISAATRDPRFQPVIENELDDLEYSVDVLSKPFEVTDLSHLDHKKYGVIVKKGYRQGVLLPDIDGVSSVNDQLRIAAQKAGIDLSEDPQILAFEVNRFGKK